jgi:nitrate reductase NapE component
VSQERLSQIEEQPALPDAQNGLAADADAAEPPVVATKTNKLAILALVLAIVSGPVLALVLGYIARRQIDRSGGRQTGRGMAVTAIVLGWVILGIVVVAFVGGFLAGATGN